MNVQYKMDGQEQQGGRGGCASAPLGVDEQVEQRVEDIELVVRDVAHGLLSHGALVRVAGGLVVVGVGDQAGHHSQHCEGLNLKVRCCWACMADSSQVLFGHSPYRETTLHWHACTWHVQYR